jgi:DNA N-6-adenine-methyltransferase (Dam)
MIEALLTSNTPEHYTPPEVINKVLEFYGGVIDLDPCSNSLDDPNVPAVFHYALPTLDGLKLPWAGRVYVNPPYGKELALWVKKALEEYTSGRAREILLLVPSRTDTRWFHQLNAYPRLYIKGRLKFIGGEEENTSSAPFPSVLFYLGDRGGEFKGYWQDWGDVANLKERGTKFDKTSYQREYMRKRRAKTGASPF